MQGSAEPLIRRCRVCQTASAREGFFLGPTWQPLCYACAARRHDRQLRAWNVVGPLSLLGAIGIHIHELATTHSLMWVLMYALLMWGLFPIGVVLHELGHVVFGALVGMRILRVELGYGPILVQARFVGVEWVVRAVIVQGFVYGGHQAPRLGRDVVFMAGGALANGLCVVAGLATALALHRAGAPTLGLHLAGGWVVTHAFVGVSSLLPYRASTPLGNLPTDGLMLVESVRRPEAFLASRRAALVLIQASISIWDKRYDDAIELLEAAVGSSPEGERHILHAQLAASYLCAGRLSEARELLEVLVAAAPDDNESTRLMAPINKSNLAYVGILEEPGRYLDQADGLSREAVDAVPLVPQVLGLRGMVLTELGALDEGAALLRAAIDLCEDPSSKGAFGTYLAICERRRGHLEVASRALARARELDPQEPLLERARLAMHAG